MTRYDPMLDSRHLRTSQYARDDNLTKRITLHQRFSTNPQPWFGWLFDQVNFPDQSRVLEIGCGTGSFWYENQHRLPHGLSLTISDLSGGMLDVARERLPAIAPQALIADAQRLPLANAAFDIVIANHVLHHVPNIPAAVTEIRRVLRPGGTFIAAANGRQNMRELFALMRPEGSTAAARATQEHFNLENGSMYLSRSFSSVERRDFDNDLAVTEVEPVIDYLASAQTEDRLTPKAIDHARIVVERAISRVGTFHIRKSTGVFISR